MKLRISGDSVRIRLTQPETARLASGEAIEQTTHFSPTSQLITRVEPVGKIAVAEFSGNSMTIRIPAETVRRWAHCDEVSIEAEQPAGGGRVLKILIEKDFQCLHSRAAEEADAFPNPAAG